MEATTDSLGALTELVGSCVPDAKGHVCLQRAALLELLERARVEQRREVEALTLTAGRLAGRLEAD